MRSANPGPPAAQGRIRLLLFLAFQTRHLRITVLTEPMRDLLDPFGTRLGNTTVGKKCSIKMVNAIARLGMFMQIPGLIGQFSKRQFISSANTITRLKTRTPSTRLEAFAFIISRALAVKYKVQRTIYKRQLRCCIELSLISPLVSGLLLLHSRTVPRSLGTAVFKTMELVQ